MHGGPRWTRPAQSNTRKNDRYKQQQRRSPAFSLLAEPTVICSPAKAWNWLQATGEPAILLQCSYVFAQKLLQQFHMHTQDLTAFINQKPDFKLEVLRSCTTVYCNLYKMTTKQTSVIIRLQLKVHI